VFSAKDLANFSTSDNYSLADDVTLPETWVGPSSYTGSFYGNGYAVNLHLVDVASNTSGDTGLFSSLADGARINDLVLNVSSPADGLAMSGSNYFGGFIGCKRGDVTISNSYATGNVTVGADNSRQLTAGGLVARNDMNALTIDHCYATGTIALTKSGGTVGNFMYAGGLIGYFKAGTATIRNSAALNESVTVDGAPTFPRAGNRISGLGGSLQNNFALSTMNIGVASGAPVVSGDAGSVNGADKTLTEFQTTTPWTALGFDTAIWDFGAISTLGRPVLK
jgi:hypothetical protein